jgi:hypothetical protein
MMRKIVELMTSFMKDQETHIEFKVKYIKKEILCSLTPEEGKNFNPRGRFRGRGQGGGMG